MPILIIAEDIDDDERTGARTVLRACSPARRSSFCTPTRPARNSSCANRSRSQACASPRWRISWL
jgi:hypothetical protein